MHCFENREALQQELGQVRDSGHRIGLVPTMGNLHDGHLALVEAARARSYYVLATIFINPLQFGPGEDLENYPSSRNADIVKLEAAKCDSVFIPAVSEMYPNGLDNQTLVTVPGLSENYCGKSRPGHFAGVCTVVSKLFNLTMPDMAFFGEKDYQQLQIIRKMTADLCIPVEVFGVPTVRTGNGLALSSRNNYLDDRQREKAAGLYRNLKAASEKIIQGEKNFAGLEREATDALEVDGIKVDYFSVCHAQTLEPAIKEDCDLVILAAAWVGPTRLIDNIRVSIDS